MVAKDNITNENDAECEEYLNWDNFVLQVSRDGMLLTLKTKNDLQNRSVIQKIFDFVLSYLGLERMHTVYINSHYKASIFMHSHLAFVDRDNAKELIGHSQYKDTTYSISRDVFNKIASYKANNMPTLTRTYDLKALTDYLFNPVAKTRVLKMKYRYASNNHRAGTAISKNNRYAIDPAIPLFAPLNDELSEHNTPNLNLRPSPTDNNDHYHSDESSLASRAKQRHQEKLHKQSTQPLPKETTQDVKSIEGKKQTLAALRELRNADMLANSKKTPKKVVYSFRNVRMLDNTMNEIDPKILKARKEALFKAAVEGNPSMFDEESFAKKMPDQDLSRQHQNLSNHPANKSKIHVRGTNSNSLQRDLSKITAENNLSKFHALKHANRKESAENLQKIQPYKTNLTAHDITHKFRDNLISYQNFKNSKLHSANEVAHEDDATHGSHIEQNR